MDVRVLPYSIAGWKQKVRIFEGLFSTRPAPPFLYNDVLIIVPSSRAKRSYGRLFIDIAERRYSTKALVQPEIQTLHQLLQNLYVRLGGPRLIDENARLVLLEGIVKDRLNTGSSFSLDPDILAPSLSSALAKTIEQISGAGISPSDLSLKIKETDFSDKPQVTLLIEVYERYEQALEKNGLIDPAGMRLALRDRFDPLWFTDVRTIIIDGIPDMSLLEAGIMKKIVNSLDGTYLVDAPSASLLNRAGESHPLRIIKDALALAGIFPKEEGAVPEPEQCFLASALFSDKPFSETADQSPASFLTRINLLSAVNPREEVTLIASEVKRSLRSGTAADSILVAFPALDEYGPLVEELFSDYGIPYNRALGRQLSTSAVATALISLLRSCQEDFSGPSLLRVFSSPFLKFAENRAIAPALDRLMRERRIAGGKLKLLAALKCLGPDEGGAGILSNALNELVAALEQFSPQGTLPLSVWMKRLDGLVAWSGLGARVAAIHGPLNVNLQAYKKLVESLGSLARAGRLFPGYQYSFNEWLFLLKRTFMHTRFQVPPEDEGGVQILGLEESLGHAWEEIHLGGLVDGKFPQRLPQNIFLPEQTLEAMGVRTLERSRLNAAYHFYRLLLSAEKVTLTWPENEGDRPVVPSPFLEELTPLRKAGLLNRGIEKASGIQFSLKIEDSRSIPELAKAIGLAAGVKGLNDILGAGIEGISGIRSALEDKPAAPAREVTGFIKREFWVTELDDYLRCPYDYYVKYVLRIEPLEAVTEDISPMDRGSKVHAILRNFYLSWAKPVTKESRDEARTLLRKLAGSAFDHEADTFRNRREKELFLAVMAERFLDGEEKFWKQGFRPAYLEQKIERYPIVLPNGVEVELSAKVDRVDVDDSGDFIIVDYKTGKYPLPKMNTDQDIFQLPVYAVMAQHALSGKDPALKRPVGLAYYDLAGKTGAAARDVVIFNKEARNDHPSSKPNASPKSAEEFDTILKQSMDKARKAVEGILAGKFTSAPVDENKCRSCPNEPMCGKNEP